MRLEGLHHITAITGDAPGNVEFYAGVLGLRLVKKTVNFDAPDVYHLYYGDEAGAPGSILTFFEFPGVARGRRGAGAIHRIEWRVASDASIAFWRDAWRARGVASAEEAASCASRTRRASPTRSSSPTCPTRRCAPTRPTSPPTTRCAASTACAPTPPAISRPRGRRSTRSG